MENGGTMSSPVPAMRTSTGAAFWVLLFPLRALINIQSMSSATAPIIRILSAWIRSHGNYSAGDGYAPPENIVDFWRRKTSTVAHSTCKCLSREGHPQDNHVNRSLPRARALVDAFLKDSWSPQIELSIFFDTQLQPESSLEELVADADVFILATPRTEPVFPGALLDQCSCAEEIAVHLRHRIIPA
ncbi:uncharacterized protein BDV17DRAFT_262004 [Aspergillus undulatus]|uniref:uncharacterized protein n=1 Tax=Aspergillus undulatus TaxID=1810928 RepID=UPI003CCD4D2E